MFASLHRHRSKVGRARVLVDASPSLAVHFARHVLEYANTMEMENAGTILLTNVVSCRFSYDMMRPNFCCAHYVVRFPWPVSHQFNLLQNRVSLTVYDAAILQCLEPETSFWWERGYKNSRQLTFVRTVKGSATTGRH